MGKHVTKEKCFPLQQGDLDSLCAVYAVINSLYLQTKGVGWPSDKSDSLAFGEKLFVHLIERIALEGNLFLTITAGMDVDDVLWLVEKAKIYLGEHTPENAKVIEALGGSVVENPTLECLKKYVQSGVQVIVSFVRQSDGFDHYTVVSSMEEDGVISIFDSYGLSQLRCDEIVVNHAILI
jgi:hypothetical protein